MLTIVKANHVSIMESVELITTNTSVYANQVSQVNIVRVELMNVTANRAKMMDNVLTKFLVIHAFANKVQYSCINV